MPNILKTERTNLKALHVNHLLDPRSGGGTAERTLQLSRFLSRAGVDCTVVTLDIGITEQRMRALENTKLVALPCLNRRYFIPYCCKPLIDALVAETDVVHISGHWTLLNALVYQACRKHRKPFAFCPAGALKPYGRSLFLKRIYNFWVGRNIAQHADKCIAITDDERMDFLAYGVPSAKVTVIPNGIDPDVSDRPQTVPQTLAKPPYILFLGRLNQIKGPDLLLHAFAKVADAFPDTQLVYAGADDGMQQTLTDLRDKLALVDRVHFVGYVDGEEKTSLLKQASLLAIPSRHEAMSIVILEAGMCQIPVLFTDTCGLDAFATAGAGNMVTVSDDALAAGISEILSNKTAASATAKKLATLVRQNYLWPMQAEKYLGLYKQMAGRD